MRLLIAGGGTGGHLYPGLAIAKEIEVKAQESKVFFVGSRRGREEEIVLREGFDFSPISAKKLSEKINLAILPAIFSYLLSLLQSLFILRRFEPDVVMGMGGYLSLPVMLVSLFLRLPTLIHEQNALPGRANIFLSRWVRRILISYEESERYFPQNKVRMSGNPVREIKKDKRKVREELGLDEGKKIILIFGGSQGAKKINQATLAALPQLLEKGWQIVHITGLNNYQEVREKMEEAEDRRQMSEGGNYKIFPYLDNLLEVINLSSFVVCRAGATTCAELTYLGKPALLVPYPYAKGAHQEYNANILERAGAAKVCRDEELSGALLKKVIEEVLENPSVLAKMEVASKGLGKPEAKKIILDEIYGLPG